MYTMITAHYIKIGKEKMNSIKLATITVVMCLCICLITSCTGTLNDMPYHWEDGLPRFEWVEPAVFQQNLEECRRRSICKVETIFDTVFYRQKINSIIT